MFVRAGVGPGANEPGGRPACQTFQSNYQGSEETENEGGGHRENQEGETCDQPLPEKEEIRKNGKQEAESDRDRDGDGKVKNDETEEGQDYQRESAKPREPDRGDKNSKKAGCPRGGTWRDCGEQGGGARWPRSPPPRPDDGGGLNERFLSDEEVAEVPFKSSGLLYSDAVAMTEQFDQRLAQNSGDVYNGDINGHSVVEKFSVAHSGQTTQYPPSRPRLAMQRVSSSCNVEFVKTSRNGVLEVAGSSSSPVVPRVIPCTSCGCPMSTMNVRSLSCAHHVGVLCTL